MTFHFPRQVLDIGWTIKRDFKTHFNFQTLTIKKKKLIKLCKYKD